MTPEALVAVITVVLTQIGLGVSVWLGRRKTKQDTDTSSVEILKSVNGELRTEMVRINDARNEETRELTGERDMARKDADQLRDELAQARNETRGAHETAGRAMRRVEYLERILRDRGIAFDPGPLA